jgi:hypothetical protein
VSLFRGAKLWALDAVDLSRDALHVHVGLAVFLGGAALFGWRLSGWRPWALAAAAALAGEAWDVRDSMADDDPVYLDANLHDLWNTMLWPSALMLLARVRRLRP